MNEFLESINKNPDLEKLKALLEFHFGKFLVEKFSEMKFE